MRPRGPAILLSAVEPSADAMGAALVPALRARLPGVRLVGCGGPQMAAAGFEGAFDTRRLAVMGLGDALRAVPEAARRARQLARLAADARADAAVLIDGWGFSRLVATRTARASPGTALVKLAAPQVWASRPGRAAFVRAHFSLVLTLLPFEPLLFEGPRTRAAFVGNPNFEAAARAPRDGGAFRARHGLGDAPVLAVLPGSRAGEVRRLAPVLGETAARVAEAVPRLRVVVPAAPAVEAMVREAAARWAPAPLVVPGPERFDAFAAASAAVSASGTVTTELAICGVPTVVGYRTDALTAAWARRVLVTPHVSVVNVAAGAAVMPEHLQEDCTPERLGADAARLLTDEAARRRQLDAFGRVVPTLLGEGDAAARAADEVARLLGQREHPGDLNAGA